VWPLELRRRRDILRIGAHAVELWRGFASALELVACEPLPRRASLYEPAALTEPLQALAGQVEGARVAVVLESAFAPVLLADTGGLLTRREHVQALLRHRFGLAYGEPGADVASWTLRADHRFGERYAVGYALPPAVERVLVEVARSAKLEFAAWQPALAWGLDRLDPGRRWPDRNGWWIWPEQDRSLVVRLAGRRAEALNPAASRCATMAEVRRSIATEGVRSGLDVETAPIGVGHWRLQERPTGDDAGVECFPVAPGEGSKPEPAPELGTPDVSAVAR